MVLFASKDGTVSYVKDPQYRKSRGKKSRGYCDYDGDDAYVKASDEEIIMNGRALVQDRFVEDLLLRLYKGVRVLSNKGMIGKLRAVRESGLVTLVEPEIESTALEVYELGKVYKDRERISQALRGVQLLSKSKKGLRELVKTIKTIHHSYDIRSTFRDEEEGHQVGLNGNTTKTSTPMPSYMLKLLDKLKNYELPKRES